MLIKYLFSTSGAFVVKTNVWPSGFAHTTNQVDIAAGARSIIDDDRA